MRTLHGTIVWVLLLTGLSVASQASIIAADFQFNTVGDTEGWSSRNVTDMDVRSTVSGSETVLSGTASTTDPRLTYGEGIDLPVSASEWESLVFRFRQLDGSPVGGGTAKAYDTDGTVLRIDAFGILDTLPSATTPEGIYTVENQADNWILMTVDLSGQTASSIPSVRIDPVGGTSGDGFEMDSVTFTAIPEPMTLGLLGIAGLLVATRVRREV